MKLAILSAGICTLSFANATQAQDLTDKKVTSPKFILGLQTGLNRENQHTFNSPNYYSGNAMSISYPSMGIFARYRLGEHFAIQGGIEATKFNPVFYTNQSYYPHTVVYPNYTSSVKTISFDVPISFQYHLLGSESKIRPYFGLGWMTRFNFYNIRETYNDQFNMPRSDTRKEAHSFGHLMVSQGVTWQLNKKWQLNQSVNYMFNGAANMFNFRFGVGYTIK